MNVLETLYNRAQRSPLDKRCGAVIVYRGQIISVGYNYPKTAISTKLKSHIL